MKRLLIASTLLFLASSPAAAQDSNDLRVRVGAGAQLRPEFLGADDTEIAPLWDIDIAKGTKPFRFEAPDDKFAIPLISTNSFSAGPTANVEWKRKESDVGAPVGKVDTTFEAGVFAQFLPAQSIRLRGDVRKGIGGHEGVVGGLSVDKIWRDGDKYVFSVGPRISFSDAKYQRAYFGVDSAASTASGLPVYRPGGGVHAAGLATGVSYQLSDRFGLFGYGRYERLLGDAAKSPIVRELGSRDQLSGGLGLSYTFTIQR
jgi:outer membrane protein